MSLSALERLNSDKPYIATQGALLCVIKGFADAQERAAIIQLSNNADADFRVAGRTIRDWVLAIMDVLNIMAYSEDDPDIRALVSMMQNAEWKRDMSVILSK